MSLELDVLPPKPIRKVVIDTNVVLDLWLYLDTHTHELKRALEAGVLHWVATRDMREELARVLQYEHIQARLLKGSGAQGSMEEDPGAEHLRTGQFILQHMERLAHFEEPAPKAQYVCKDTDDQKFIDLAQAHQALLLSKDKAVLCMKNRMARVGVRITRVYEPSAPL